MMRLWFQRMLLIWLLMCLIFAGFIWLVRDKQSTLMRVRVVGADYLIDFDTGLTVRTHAAPPPVPDSRSPDGQYIVTVVGSPRGSSYRILHIPSQTFEMVGPYRSPASAHTPVYWTDSNHLWLITLSQNRQETVLRGIDPASPQTITDRYTYDFPAYYVRLSPNRQWLVLGSEAFATDGIAHSIYDIALANVETGQLVPLGISDTVRIRWSRNGEWVVTQYRSATRLDDTLTIRFYHIPTEREFITHAHAFERQLSWSADGRFAAYRIQNNDETYSLFLLNLHTLENTLLLKDAIPSNVYWVGNELLIEGFTEPERTIYRMENTKLVRLTTLPQSSYAPLTFSTDAKYLVYYLRESQITEVVRLNILNGNHETISTFTTMPLSIEWED